MRKLAALAIILLLPSLAAALTPKEILEKSDRSRGKGPGLTWTIEMTSVEQGQNREQTLQVRAKEDKALVTFEAPARVKGQKMLIAGRNMWFIKPGVSKPMPISPRQKLMGQAANGDIASTNYSADYEGKLTGEEAIDGKPCYVLDLTAKNTNLTYDRIVYWVSKDQLVGVKADFYTVSGKKFKSALFEYANTVSYGGERYPFVSRMLITDAVRPGEVTTLNFGQVSIKEVPDATFNLNLLLK